MKLVRFDSVTNAEAGVEFELPDPITGVGSGAFVTVLGADSKVYQAAVKEILQRNRAKGTAGMSEEDSIEVIARCVTGWRGIEDDHGKPLAFSQEKAKEIMRGYPVILARVSEFVTNRAGFFPKP